MATYLLDTSVIIDLLRNRRGRAGLLRELLLQGHLLACCAVNVAEIYAGVRLEEQARTEEFLGSLRYAEITREIARAAGLLRRNYARRGITLTLPDTMIAAVAISGGMPLLTDNARHFPMKEIELYPLPR